MATAGAVFTGTGGSVLIDTPLGPVAVELYWSHAPAACQNFYELARKGYYDGTVFHRVIKGTISWSERPMQRFHG